MEVKDVDKCRSCLSECEIRVPLFEIYEHNLTMAEILQACLKTEVNKEDGFPNVLCEHCVLVITQFYNFMVIYEQCEKDLRSSLVKYETLHGEEEEQDMERSVELFEGDLDDSQQLDEILQNENLLSFENKDDVKLYDFADENGEDVFDGHLEFEIRDDEDDKDKLQVEVLAFEKITKFVCDLCGEEHLFATSFSNHMRVKHNLIEVDLAKYSNEIQVKVNKRVNKSISDGEDIPKVYNVNNKCKYCLEEYTDRTLYQKHMLTHKEYKKYICEACGARFIRKTYLVDHMEGHSNELKHKCKFCGKAFRRRTVLRAHKRVHTHPNHYQCEICGRAFTNHSTLRTHRLLIHVRERNFECVRCNLTFPLKSTLKKHILRHQKRENGEKGFDCPQCEMQYRDKSSLKRHMETKHQGKIQMIVCPVCPKKYVSRTNVLKHMRKHHPDTIL